MKTLAAIVADEQMQQFVPPLYFIQGMVFAVAASPEIPMPETWMPWLIRGDGTAPDAQRVDELADGLMSELRVALQDMRDDETLLPKSLADNRAPNKELEQWLTGLLNGHQHLESCWQRAWSMGLGHTKKSKEDAEAPAKRLRRCLKLFSVLANPDLALASRSEDEAAALKKNLPLLYQQLPSMLREYVTLAGELAQSLPNQFESVPANQPNGE